MSWRVGSFFCPVRILSFEVSTLSFLLSLILCSRLNNPDIDLYMFLYYRCRDCCHTYDEDQFEDILRGGRLEFYFHRLGKSHEECAQ